MSRADELKGLGEAIESNSNDLAKYIAEESGSTLSHAKMELSLGAYCLKTMDSELPLIDGMNPAGKVAIVLPYNSVCVLFGMSLGAAYLAGNDIELRLSAKTKKTSAMLEDLVKSRLDRSVSFSYDNGIDFIEKSIMNDTNVIHVFGHDSWMQGYKEKIKASGKKLIFEGPGKDPCIILDDADLKKYANEIVMGACSNSGQICMSLERFYVHKNILDEAVNAIYHVISGLKTGNPLEEDTDVGPLMSRRAYEIIGEQIKDAVKKGAKILHGGKLETRKINGKEVYIVYPTLITGVDRSMKIMQEETFGPIIPVQEVSNGYEAMALACRCSYALGSSVFSGGENNYVNEILKRNHGFSLHNATFLTRFDPHAPWGGYKNSGWIWETDNGIFRKRDGPKQLSVEFSKPFKIEK